MSKPGTLLLTNDDSWKAEGLHALRTRFEKAGWECYTVAPLHPMSLCGHRVTTEEPLYLEQQSEKHWTVNGTPADCVRVALHHLRLKPQWVFSGINHGGNLGQDTYISGTVAAAREATYHGLKAVSYSHYLKKIPLNWERAADWCFQTFEALEQEELQPAEFWNLNLPHLPPEETVYPGYQWTSLERAPLNVEYQSVSESESRVRLDYCSVYAQRPNSSNTDVQVCFDGKISLSKIQL